MCVCIVFFLLLYVLLFLINIRKVQVLSINLFCLNCFFLLLSYFIVGPESVIVGVMNGFCF